MDSSIWFIAHPSAWATIAADCGRPTWPMRPSLTPRRNASTVSPTPTFCCRGRRRGDECRGGLPGLGRGDVHGGNQAVTLLDREGGNTDADGAKTILNEARGGHAPYSTARGGEAAPPLRCAMAESSSCAARTRVAVSCRSPRCPR